MRELAELNGREMRLNLHPGQRRAWDSDRRFVGVIAGTQSGKTAFGPWWLLREIKLRGPGDYLVVTPTFALLEKKLLPEFRRLFGQWMQLGRYTASPVRKFEFSPDGSRRTFGFHDPNKPTVIFFGYAEDPDSLESATVKAAWLDECGQRKFRLGSWEAIQRRLAIHQGRALLTTTPYDLGWLKQKIWDPWESAGRKHPDIEVVNFDSTENPAFPQEEFERARAVLPQWKFDLFYRGIFTRPAGMIYDVFDRKRHTTKRFPIPKEWPRYLGLDFGGVNTAGLFLAQDVTTRAGREFYAYREYLQGGRTARGHVKVLRKDEPAHLTAVGGAGSEDQWRDEFGAGGLEAGEQVSGLHVLEPPIRDVEVGIDRLYAMLAEDELCFFDDLVMTLGQMESYSRKLDDAGNVTEIIDEKQKFHLLDAGRYLASLLRRESVGVPMTGGSRPILEAYKQQRQVNIPPARGAMPGIRGRR